MIYIELNYVNLGYFQSYPWPTMAVYIYICLAVQHQSAVWPIRAEPSHWGVGFQSWESRPCPQSSDRWYPIHFNSSAHFLMDSFHSAFLFVEYSLCVGRSRFSASIYKAAERASHILTRSLLSLLHYSRRTEPKFSFKSFSVAECH